MAYIFHQDPSRAKSLTIRNAGRSSRRKPSSFGSILILASSESVDGIPEIRSQLCVVNVYSQSCRLHVGYIWCRTVAGFRCIYSSAQDISMAVLGSCGRDIALVFRCICANRDDSLLDACYRRQGCGPSCHDIVETGMMTAKAPCSLFGNVC